MRDYSYEHRIRKTTNKRILADIDRLKADRFLEALKVKGITYSSWLNSHIDNELKGDR
jgi:hypothetical protein